MLLIINLFTEKERNREQVTIAFFPSKLGVSVKEKLVLGFEALYHIRINNIRLMGNQMA